MKHSFQRWMWHGILFTIFTALIFAVLRWLQMNPGDITLWVSAVVIYWVLSGITILPWNLYFAADDVLQEIRETEEKGGKPNEQDKAYAVRVKKTAWLLALCLHGATALFFLVLAIFIKWQDTTLGTICYAAAFAALGLILLRPSLRAVDHMMARLWRLGERARYPRDDVYELKKRVQELVGYDETAKQMQKTFDAKCEELDKNYRDQVAAAQAVVDKQSRRIKELEYLIEHIQQNISDKINTFDDAVAFKTAWNRVISEFAEAIRRRQAE
jgi:hypothetical protein